MHHKRKCSDPARVLNQPIANLSYKAFSLVVVQLSGADARQFVYSRCIGRYDVTGGDIATGRLQHSFNSYWPTGLLGKPLNQALRRRAIRKYAGT
jgi:hypothetical protein